VTDEVVFQSDECFLCDVSGGLYIPYHDKADIKGAAPSHSAQRYAEVSFAQLDSATPLIKVQNPSDFAELSFAQLDSSAAGSACTLRVRDPSKEKPILARKKAPDAFAASGAEVYQTAPKLSAAARIVDSADQLEESLPAMEETRLPTGIV